MANLISFEDDGGAVVFIRLDVVTTASHEAVVTITEHPVEEGSNIVDHARPEPDRVSIEGYVSNKPLMQNPDVEKIMEFSTFELDLPAKQGGAPIFTPGGLTQAAVGAVGSFFNEPQHAATALRAIGDAPNRARVIFDLLTEAKDKGKICRVETRMREYDNLLIERIAVPQTTADGNGATMQIDFRRIRIVKAKLVDAPMPAEVRGAPAVSKGSKSSELDKKDREKAEKSKTAAAALFDGGRDALSDFVGGGF